MKKKVWERLVSHLITKESQSRGMLQTPFSTKKMFIQKYDKNNFLKPFIPLSSLSPINLHRHRLSPTSNPLGNGSTPMQKVTLSPQSRRYQPNPTQPPNPTLTQDQGLMMSNQGSLLALGLSSLWDYPREVIFPQRAGPTHSLSHTTTTTPVHLLLLLVARTFGCLGAVEGLRLCAVDIVQELIDVSMIHGWLP